MKSKTPFLVYYGHDSSLIPQLQEADMLIFESRGWSDEDVQRLREKGTKLIGYVSAIAWPDWLGPVKWWWGTKERDPQWGAWWLSLSSMGWRHQFNKMWREVGGSLDGLFFDNLDRLQQDPKSLQYLISILQSIRQEWPDGHFVGNRGFEHWSRIGKYFDGILFENMTDQAFTAQDRTWVSDQIQNLQRTQIYALDYKTRAVPKEVERLCVAFPQLKYYRAPDEGLQTLG